ncbi:hypothetical protein Q428_08835 [Fervidicella metallireducens AeB]|uniref:Uncharacterized protein n=1 Tax=Fervidicella metallireducens AeB TaxID=1403537 RepID=A0A017RUJ2_9CLOT|nr:hypothetical protein [Fervidicella metallireducens]EYE88296.1 hypothetical protein Q428_08835 [Fervidicella metallireducens AeB]
MASVDVIITIPVKVSFDMNKTEKADQGVQVQSQLRKAIEKYGVPKEVVIDRARESITPYNERKKTYLDSK